MVRRELRLLLLVVAAGLTAATGCAGHAPPEPGACTLMGCYSGVALELVGDLPDSYTVTLYAPGEAPRVVECSPAQLCGGRVFFEGVTANDVQVEVAGDLGVRERRSVGLTYTTSQPNGPGCPPICRNATARVEF